MSPVEKDQTLTSSSLGSSLNKIPHSQSTPGVSGSKTPPTTPRRGGKMLNVRVQMLDDSVTLFQVQVWHSNLSILLGKGINHIIL